MSKGTEDGGANESAPLKRIGTPDRAKSATYPSKSEVQRLIRVAQSSGIEVGAIEVGPDGTIRVFGASAERCSTGTRDRGGSEFDRWEACGRL